MLWVQLCDILFSSAFALLCKCLTTLRNDLRVRSSFSNSTLSLVNITVVASTESHQSIFNTVQQEMAVRRQQKSAIQRQDSRLSVKSLIESIENSAKQVCTVCT